MSKAALEAAKRAKDDAKHESAQEAEIRRIAELVTGTAPEQVKKRNTTVVVAAIALVVVVIVIVAKKRK